MHTAYVRDILIGPKDICREKMMQKVFLDIHGGRIYVANSRHVD
jgi:hypothetical protein